MNWTSTRRMGFGKGGHMWTIGHGGWGEKMPEFCGRLLWMAPKIKLLVTFVDITFSFIARQQVYICSGLYCVISVASLRVDAF